MPANVPSPALRATIELSHEEDGPATDVWVPNTYEHEQALTRLVTVLGYGATVEHTEWPEIDASADATSRIRGTACAFVLAPGQVGLGIVDRVKVGAAPGGGDLWFVQEVLGATTDEHEIPAEDCCVIDRDRIVELRDLGANLA